MFKHNNSDNKENKIHEVFKEIGVELENKSDPVPEKKQIVSPNKVSAEEGINVNKGLAYLETNKVNLNDQDIEGLAGLVQVHQIDANRPKSKIESLGLAAFVTHLWMMYSNSLSLKDYQVLIVKEQKRRDPSKAWKKEEDDTELVKVNDVREFMDLLLRQHPIVLEQLFLSRRSDIEATRSIVDDFSLILERIKELDGMAKKLLAENKTARYIDVQKALNAAQDLYYKYTKEIKQRITFETLENHIEFIFSVIRDVPYLDATQKSQLFDDIAAQLQRSSNYFSDNPTVIDGSFTVKPEGMEE